MTPAAVRQEGDRAVTGQRDVFLDLLGYVESGNNDAAVGDGGKALGRYQLHKEYVDECNRIASLEYGHEIQPWSYEDRLSPQRSGAMVVKWTGHWVAKMEKKCHIVMTNQDRLSLHRWGPTKWCPKCNEHPVDVSRWEKAKQYLEAQQ
jgi:hypothetical protein